MKTHQKEKNGDKYCQKDSFFYVLKMLVWINNEIRYQWTLKFKKEYIKKIGPSIFAKSIKGGGQRIT